jgi:hypothetical protein
MELGKTRWVARRVTSFLESVRHNVYSPLRVLVIASSHYAVDNFLEEFESVSGGKYKPFRYVSQSRISVLDEERRLTRKIHEQSHAYYQQALREALGDAQLSLLEAAVDEPEGRECT